MGIVIPVLEKCSIIIPYKAESVGNKSTNVIKASINGMYSGEFLVCIVNLLNLSF